MAYAGVLENAFFKLQKTVITKMFQTTNTLFHALLSGSQFGHISCTATFAVYGRIEYWVRYSVFTFKTRKDSLNL